MLSNLQFVQDIQATFRAVYRVLRAGGRFAFCSRLFFQTHAILSFASWVGCGLGFSGSPLRDGGHLKDPSGIGLITKLHQGWWFSGSPIRDGGYSKIKSGMRGSPEAPSGMEVLQKHLIRDGSWARNTKVYHTSPLFTRHMWNCIIL